MFTYNASQLEEVLKSDIGRFRNAESLTLAALRRAIITGTLPPGQMIDEEMIASHLHLSRMPVRQALAILESEGLVVRAYKRGVTVTELNRSEIEEIYHIRANLEGLAISRAVANYSDVYLDSVADVLSDLQQAGNDSADFVDLNTRFHTMLYEPSGWDTLCGLIIKLRNNIARYVAISHDFIQARPSLSVDHGKIFDACRRRDTESAADLTRQHVFNAMNILLKTFETEAWISVKRSEST